MFGEITSVQERKRLAQTNQAPKGSIGPVFNKSNNEDHKDSLKSNKPGPFEAPIRPFEAPTGPFEAPAAPPQASLA